MKHALRLPAIALAAMVTACVSVSPSPTPSPSPEPTTSPVPAVTATIGVLPSFQASPTPTVVASPTLTPTASPPPPPSLSPVASLAPQLSAALQTALDEARLARDIPGIGASIIFPDGSRWDSGSGDAVLDERSAGADTPFVVGSITKTFVAALIMQLAEEGELSLDDPLSGWLPEYPRADEITVRHLLGHTSGVFNYFEHRAYVRLVYGRPDHDWTPREILQTFDAAPRFAPGAGYHYSNTGFVLLGMVAQQVMDEPLVEQLERRYFEPLQLSETYFQTDDSLLENAAHGYLPREGNLTDVTDDTGYRPTRSAATVAWAAGAIVGSARDIATWGDALYGGELLEEESLTEMTDYAASVYSGGAYGLGTRTRLFDGHRMFGHTGSLRGFSAAMWHFPDSDLTITVLTNRGRIDANVIIDALSAIAVPPAERFQQPIP